MQQVNAILHAGQAVGHLPEVVLAKVFLAVEVERAVVGRHDLEIVLAQAAPQFLLVVFRPKGRRAHELGTLEAVAHVIERQEQVLGTGFGEGHRAAIAGGPDLVQRIACR